MQRRRKPPLAGEDRRLDRVCPCVVTVAEVGERRRGPEKRDPPWHRGAWTGTGPEGDPRGSRAGQRRREAAPRWQSRGAGEGRSRASERALRGEGPRSMEGTPGRFPEALVHAGAAGPASAAFAGFAGARAPRSPAGEATGVSEARSVRATTGRQRPPRWNTEGNVRPAEANGSAVKAGDLSGLARRKPRRLRKPTRYGC